MTERVLRRAAAAGCAGLLATLTACAAAPAAGSDDGKIQVVASTSILADVVSNVAGDAAHVTGLIPPGKDPHTFEPGLRAVRDIAYADAVFTNGLLLEPRSLTHTIDTTAPSGTRVVEVADQAQRYGFAPMPLVEDAGLDAVWLGLKVAPVEGVPPLPKTGVVDLSLTHVDGPGDVAAYVVGTFGTPEVLFNSRDGLSDHDKTTLPADAHTHVSWAFSAPGVYKLSLAARARQAVGAEAHTVAEQTITVAVGVDPGSAITGSGTGTTVLDHGHVDITAELQGIDHPGRLLLRGDAPVADAARQVTASTRQDYDPEHTVIAVPNSTLQPVPAQREFRFLGNPGQETYLLPQAVLGKHVHGEFDPHIWHDVASIEAVTKVVRDELSAVDPDHSGDYHANAERYLAQLDRLDAEVKGELGGIDKPRRNLVTTHDGYGYLGAAYGLKVAGFVTPNPSVEPSPRDMVALTRTLQNLHVPAVFLEPQLKGRSAELTETAKRLGIAVCPIWGDSLDPPGTGPATSYIELMRANAHSLRTCLAEQGQPAPATDETTTQGEQK